MGDDQPTIKDLKEVEDEITSEQPELFVGELRKLIERQIGERASEVALSSQLEQAGAASTSAQAQKELQALIGIGQQAMISADARPFHQRRLFDQRP